MEEEWDTAYPAKCHKKRSGGNCVSGVSEKKTQRAFLMYYCSKDQIYVMCIITLSRASKKKKTTVSAAGTKTPYVICFLVFNSLAMWFYLQRFFFLTAPVVPHALLSRVHTRLFFYQVELWWIERRRGEGKFLIWPAWKQTWHSRGLTTALI